MYCTKKVTDDLLWIGADDRRLAVFEGVYGVPEGVSYNSYLVLDEKTVLFDTVDKAVSRTFFENLAHGLNGRKLDYLVISHMEPDHAATIEDVAIRHPEATIVCNAKIRDMLSRFFTLDMEGRMKIVAEGDTLSTGRHTFTFVMAPMVHWPEVMMTYDTTDKVLFSADAFGSFGALNGRLFSDEVPFMTEWIDEARRYYTNIVGKYGTQVQAVLKKAAGLEINYVCPLHSFVWRKGFGDFLAKYDKWSRYEPEEKGVLIAYASVYGHTENTANILAAKLCDRGVKVKLYDTSVTPASYIVSDAFKYSHLVFAATTYNAGVFVTMENLLHDIANHNLQNRKIALIENGSWAPTSGKLMAEILSPLKGTEFIGEKLTLRSSLGEAQLAELDSLADAIAEDIRPAAASFVPEAGSVASGAVQQEALNKLNAGLCLVTAHGGNRDCGCIINTAVQVSSGDSKRVTLSVIKENYTCGVIRQKGIFNLSVLTEDVSYDTIKCFGLRSGRDEDKFAGWPDENRSLNGLRYITREANALVSARVAETIDCGTHMLFVAEVTEAIALSDRPTCTVDYYREHIKPKKTGSSEETEGYICNICGYFHPGSELPDGFVCPLCSHGPEDFTKVVPEQKTVRKGFICKICGHFEEYDGDSLPPDYRCPLCNHGPEDFEPAEVTE